MMLRYAQLGLITMLSAITPSLADTDEPTTSGATAEITCPAKIGGIPLKTNQGKATCTYVRDNVDIRLVTLSQNKPTLETSAETMTAKLALRARKKATRLCNEAMAEQKLGARCLVSYDSHVVGLISEIKKDDQKLQARVMLFERNKIDEKQLYWSILAARALLSNVTAE